MDEEIRTSDVQVISRLWRLVHRSRIDIGLRASGPGVFAVDERTINVALSARTCSQSKRDCNSVRKSASQHVLQNSVSSRTCAKLFGGVIAEQKDVAHRATALQMECAALRVDASVTRIGRENIKTLNARARAESSRF